MMGKFLKPRFVVFAAIIAVVFLFFFFSGRQEEDFRDRYEGHDLTVVITGRENLYSRFMERHINVPHATQNVSIDIFAFSAGEGVSILENFEGEERVLRTEEDSFVEFTVYIPQTGLYSMHTEYFPLASRGIPIERALFINGESPFLGAERLAFQRVWGCAGPSRFDNQGNEIRAQQIELPRWEYSWFRDSLGHYTEPYLFFFEQGINVIRLTGINEPMAIRSLELRVPRQVQYYRDFIAGLNLDRYKRYEGPFSVMIQGEQAVRRSSPSLAPVFDRSSPATTPASVARIRLNMIGGERWSLPGQWIEWEVEVPEDGLYRISVSGRQSYNRGFVTNRTVYINGELLANELAAVPFRFSNRWELNTFRDMEGNDMLFPLRRGVNTIRIQSTLGEMGQIVSTMEESVYRLNRVFRRILSLTGPDPDIFRDYRIEIIMPDVIEAMELESRILFRLVDELTAYAGERGPQAASTLTLARQLEFFVRRPDRIPRTLNNFRGNISALGNSLLALSQAPLDIDFIYISTANAELPRIRENFFNIAAHEFRSFIASFFIDFDSLGDVYEDAVNAITVWIVAGRDQSTILKSMIDDTFTPQTGIPVNLRLVAPEALMPAVVAGMGPDIVFTVPQGDVINYAIRNAVLDLTQFPDFEEAIRDLYPSVLVPFKWARPPEGNISRGLPPDHVGVWGLPETQFFHVMFYRRDIMEELDLELPDTWDDLINILPTLQRHNMDVAIPSVANSDPARGIFPDFSNFLAHLFQRGGSLFNEDGSRVLLDEEVAVDAFDVYTKFFTHYRTPVAFDFVNRFRTGEMPLGFADYTTFNTLEVFAPELRGLWGFRRMPGRFRYFDSLSEAEMTRIRSILGEDYDFEKGYFIDRSVSTGTAAAMIIEATRQPDLAWELLKWWVSAETQLRYGRELESIMGAAARYPTANAAAFRQLPWGTQQMEVLNEMRAWTVGVPEVPGGYFVSRHITNAVRRVINEGTDTRETLLDYTLVINNELRRKRIEFGLE